MHIGKHLGQIKTPVDAPELSRASRFLLLRPELGRHRHAEAGWLDGQRVVDRVDSHEDLLGQVRAVLAEDDKQNSMDGPSPRNSLFATILMAFERPGQAANLKRRASFVAPARRGGRARQFPTTLKAYGD